MAFLPRWLGRAFGDRPEADAGNEERVANLSGFGITPTWAGSVPGSGITATPQNATAVPAVYAAIRRASQAVAELDLCVWRGRAPMLSKVSNTWQSRFFAGQPNEQQTRYEFFAAIEESRSYRGNAFVWKVKDERGRVLEAYALHPDQVLPLYFQKGRRYLIAVYPGFVDPVGEGSGFYEVGEETILHIRGHGDGGRWIAPSPLDRERGGSAIASALGALGHVNSAYDKGLGRKVAISFPQAMNPTKMREWRDEFRAAYEGPQNAGKTVVLADGATISAVGMSLADAQFVESMAFSVEDVARIFDVPPSIIWGGGSGGSARAVAPLTPEHELQRWLRYGLGPRLSSIESAFAADPDFFPPSSATFPRFDTQNFVRGDLATESGILVAEVQSGILLPDEARGIKGLPPYPNGQGKIPQITPVGGAPNPNAPPAPSTGLQPSDTGSDPSA